MSLIDKLKVEITNGEIHQKSKEDFVFCLSKENCQNTKLGHQKWYFNVDDTVLPLLVDAVYLLTKSLQAVQKTRPEVLEKWPVDLLQAVFGAGIHTDVQLSNWH